MNTPPLTTVAPSLLDLVSGIGFPAGDSPAPHATALNGAVAAVASPIPFSVLLAQMLRGSDFAPLAAGGSIAPSVHPEFSFIQAPRPSGAPGPGLGHLPQGMPLVPPVKEPNSPSAADSLPAEVDYESQVRAIFAAMAAAVAPLPPQDAVAVPPATNAGTTPVLAGAKPVGVQRPFLPPFAAASHVSHLTLSLPLIEPSPISAAPAVAFDESSGDGRSPAEPVQPPIVTQQDAGPAGPHTVPDHPRTRPAERAATTLPPSLPGTLPVTGAAEFVVTPGAEQRLAAPLAGTRSARENIQATGIAQQDMVDQSLRSGAQREANFVPSDDATRTDPADRPTRTSARHEPQPTRFIPGVPYDSADVIRGAGLAEPAHPSEPRPAGEIDRIPGSRPSLLGEAAGKPNGTGRYAGHAVLGEDASVRQAGLLSDGTNRLVSGAVGGANLTSMAEHAASPSRKPARGETAVSGLGARTVLRGTGETRLAAPPEPVANVPPTPDHADKAAREPAVRPGTPTAAATNHTGSPAPADRSLPTTVPSAAEDASIAAPREDARRTTARGDIRSDQPAAATTLPERPAILDPHTAESPQAAVPRPMAPPTRFGSEPALSAAATVPASAVVAGELGTPTDAERKSSSRSNEMRVESAWQWAADVSARSAAARLPGAGEPTQTMSPANLPDFITTRLTQTKDEQQMIEVQLDPPELGRLIIRLVRSEKGLQADFVVANEAARAAVQHELPALQRCLEQAGFALGQFSVSRPGDERAGRRDADEHPHQGASWRRGRHRKAAPPPVAGVLPRQGSIDLRV